jgi:hypothetical protein
VKLTQAELVEFHELQDIEDDCKDLEEPMPRRYKRRLMELRNKRYLPDPRVIVGPPLKPGDP